MRSIYGTLVFLSASLIITACVKDSENSNLPPVSHDANQCPTSADLPPTMVPMFRSIVPVYGGIVIHTSSDPKGDVLIDGSEHTLPGTDRNPEFYRGGCSLRGLTIHIGTKKSYRSYVYERQGNGDYIGKELYMGKVSGSPRVIQRPRPPAPPAPPTPPTPPTPPEPPPPPKITIPRHTVDQCPRQDDFGVGSENGNVDIKNIEKGITFSDADHGLVQIDGTIVKVSETESYAGGCDNRTITMQVLNGTLRTIVIKPNGHGYDRITTDDKGNSTNETYPPKAKGTQ